MSRPAMLTAAIAAFAVIFGLITPLGSGLAAAAEMPAEITLDAQNVEHDLQSGTVTATGDVQLRTDQMTLVAQHLNMDLAAHIATVIGPAKLESDGRSITGQDLRYDWETGEGQITQPATTVKGIIVSGGSAKLDKAGYLLDSSSFTTCDLPQPEYQFRAREVQVSKETDRLKAKGVTLWLFGHRIIPLPDMQLSLKDSWIGKMSREKLPVPEVGYETTRGYYVTERFGYLLGDNSFARIGLGYGSKQGLGSDLLIAEQPLPGVRVLVDGRYAERGPNRLGELDGLVSTTVSRAGYDGRLVWQVTHDDNDRDITYWPEVTLSKAFSLKTDQKAEGTTSLPTLSLKPSVDWARVSEAATGVETDRSQAKLEWSTSRLPVLGGALSARGYGQSDRYATPLDRAIWSSTISYDRPIGSGMKISLGRRWINVSGSTPFDFDDMSPANEIFLRTGYGNGSTTADIATSYDLVNRGVSSVAGSLELGGQSAWKAKVSLDYRPPNGSFESLDYSLKRQFHCFSFDIHYNQVKKQISAGFSVNK